jgi:hypothetical protein
MGRDGKRLHNVGVVLEFSEESALIGVPVTVPPRRSLCGGQGLKVLNVIGIALHQSKIVGDKSLNKNVIVGIFFLGKVPLYEKATDPRHADATGVTRYIDALGVFVHASIGGTDGVESAFGKLLSLVEVYDVPFLTAVLKLVSGVSAIGEFDTGTVGKEDAFFLVVVPCNTGKKLPQRQNVVFV